MCSIPFRDSMSNDKNNAGRFGLSNMGGRLSVMDLKWTIVTDKMLLKKNLKRYRFD